MAKLSIKKIDKILDKIDKLSLLYPNIKNHYLFENDFSVLKAYSDSIKQNFVKKIYFIPEQNMLQYGQLKIYKAEDKDLFIACNINADN